MIRDRYVPSLTDYGLYVKGRWVAAWVCGAYLHLYEMHDVEHLISTFFSEVRFRILPRMSKKITQNDWHVIREERQKGQR